MILHYSPDEISPPAVMYERSERRNNCSVFQEGDVTMKLEWWHAIGSLMFVVIWIAWDMRDRPP
jgi:hypothetical protein